MGALGTILVVWIATLVAHAVLSAFACRSIARRYRRDPVLWFWLGFFLGVLALLVLALMVRSESPEADDDAGPGPSLDPATDPATRRSRGLFPLLDVDNLTMEYHTENGSVSAVNNVSFSIMAGESLGLVGESGCGKTSVAMALLRLQADNAEFKEGEIRLNGENLLGLSEDAMRKHRWKNISMVFQGAMNAWNPVQRVGDQIREAINLHIKPLPTAAEARARMEELFALVGVDPKMLDRYPHEFSGGMRQRAIIAMALSCDPQLIIADEPTTALDVIVQDQILGQLKRIQRDFGMSMIYISHDIAVIAEVTDLIGVMYAGRIVELGPTKEVFQRPKHPYAYLLLNSAPSITGPRRKLAPLKGEPPNLLNPPTGCRFHPRCPFASEKCVVESPPLEDVGDGHMVECWHWDQVPAISERGVA